MLTPRVTHFAILFLALLSLVIVGGARPSAANRPRAGADLIVHEWGTFTSVAGRDGSTLEWRPLSVESDLPSFVYSGDKGSNLRQQRTEPQRPEPPRTEPRRLRYPSKSGTPVLVRMETPILYFYAKEETAVTVKVDFPSGKITNGIPRLAP